MTPVVLEGDLDGGRHGTAATVTDLSLDEKVALTGGADAWHTVGLPRHALPPLRLTDGPSGARGVRFTGETSTSLPCGTALAATWNPELVERVGRLLGDEARAKGAHVLLAPTVNVHRHPLAGRNFECFSEDPHLSAQLADAYIRGVQSRYVGCAVKHLVANDQEQDRLEISVDVDERALREIYLPAFEMAVRSSGVWVVMAAYNRLHGVHCSENRWLLHDLLRGEWGFDGAVVSDWFGTHSTLAAEAGLDLEMPGPARFLGRHVAAAIHQGDLAEDVVDRAAGNILRLAGRVTAEPATEAEPEPGSIVVQAATEAIVLLRNDEVLPLDPARVRSLAVLGPKADRPDVQGGGSAHVDPPYVITPLEGIRARAAEDDLTVHHEVGVPLRPPAPLGRGELFVPDHSPSGGADGRAAGLLVEYFASSEPETLPSSTAEPLACETVPQSRLFWTGQPCAGLSPRSGATVRASADFVPDRSGLWHLALTSAGASRVWLDGRVVIDNLTPTRGTSFFGRGSTLVTAGVSLDAGHAYRLIVELFIGPALGGPQEAPRWGISGVELTAQPPELAAALTSAVQAAAVADAAIVVVGEDVSATEGADRASLDLPPDQVELIRAVAEVNPATVVVVNTGAPVTLDWVAEVAGVVQLWYLGQETGEALAAVLFGDHDATGRLPTTFPRRIEDTPAHDLFPGADGRVRYGEGVLVGYRHYDTVGREPRFCFGHGLSYTEFVYSEPRVTVRDGPLDAVVPAPEDQLGGPVLVEVELEITNVGERRGQEVVQLYVHDEQASVRRPDQELKAFCKLDLGPAEVRRARLELPWRAFAFWDFHVQDWVVEPGRFELRIGSSSRAIRHVVTVDL